MVLFYLRIQSLHFLLYLFTCAYMYIQGGQLSQGTHVEVGGQLVGISS